MTPMTPKEKGNLWLGLAIVFFVLTTISYFSPPTAPATGRWAWLHNAFTGLFGAWGEVVLCAGLGSIGVLVAVSNFRAAHKGKTNA